MNFQSIIITRLDASQSYNLCWWHMLYATDDASQSNNISVYDTWCTLLMMQASLIISLLMTRSTLLMVNFCHLHLAFVKYIQIIVFVDSSKYWPSKPWDEEAQAVVRTYIVWNTIHAAI